MISIHDDELRPEVVAALKEGRVGRGSPPGATVHKLPVRVNKSKPNLTANDAEAVIIREGFAVFHRGRKLVS